MPLTAAGRDALLASGRAGFTHVGALTAIDGTEVAGGSYARQAISMGSGGSGVADTDDAETVPIPAGTTVVAVGLFDALSSGNLLAICPYGSSGQVLKGVGTAAVDDTILSNGHGLTTDDRVFVRAVMGESLPTGLSATVLYYVLASGLTSNVFKLSTTSGGSAVDITALGELAWFKTVPNIFSSAGNLSISAGALDLDLNGV